MWLLISYPCSPRSFGRHSITPRASPSSPHANSELPSVCTLLHPNFVQHLKPAALVHIDWLNADRDALWWFLQTPNPEFLDPARFALLEGFPDASSYPSLAAILEGALPFTLSDVNSDSFTANISADPEHALESWVELADRSGVLEDLLVKATALRPQSKKLSDVLAGFQRWRAAVHATALSFPIHNPGVPK